jgi:hypothetical protein
VPALRHYRRSAEHHMGGIDRPAVTATGAAQPVRAGELGGSIQ